MRRIVVALLGTLSGLVMLFSYHTSTQGGGSAVAGRPGGGSLGGLGGTDPNGGGNGTGQGGTGQGGTGQGGTGQGSSGQGSSGQNGSGQSAGQQDGSGSKIVKGDTADTRWGPVQVAIKVGGGKILAVDAIVYPTDNPRDQEINSYAVPALNQEVMDAQSANIDMISGATVTSRGYVESLQSALDKAGM